MEENLKNNSQKKDYQYNYSEINNATSSMFESKGRIPKAGKTISILKAHLKKTSNLKLLDIGSSTGIMTNEYSKHFQEVVGIDIGSKAEKFAKEKFQNDNLTFIASPLEEYNFVNSTFDVITCSHIYEHVPSDEILMDTIYNLLKPGGVCYFAAVNRFTIIEPHYRLPFLSYFPKKISNLYINLFTDHKVYYENLKSYRNLKKLVNKYKITDYTLEIIRNPSKYSASDMIKEKTVMYYLVNLIASICYFIIPTYVWILTKPKAD